MIKIKNSMYNIYLPGTDTGEYFLFNSFQGSIAVIDDAVKNSLLHRDLSSFDDDYIAALHQNGFIVEDGKDEFLAYENSFRSRVMDPGEYEFCICLTERCNLACSYCGSGERGRGRSFENETIDRAISFIKEETSASRRKNLNIRVFGGEPLLEYNILIKLLSELKEWAVSRGTGFYAALITNGTMLSGEKIGELSPFVSVVQLTLEGSREYHDKIRKNIDGSGTYDTIAGAVKDCIEAGIKVLLRIHVSKENSEGLDDLFFDLKERDFGTNEVGLSVSPLLFGSSICRFHPFQCSIGNDHGAPLYEAWRLAMKHGLNPLLKPMSNHIMPGCPFKNFYSAIIDPSGGIHRCLKQAGRETECNESLCGNIFDDPSSAGDVEKKDEPLKREFNLPACESCSYLPLCDGGCQGIRFVDENFSPGDYCRAVKEITNERIYSYIGQIRR
ncbi:Radical SAM domain protein [Methanolacinia petrolearia DSM 11571]|uniref:Radical SAM domain protein n=1 Tax=Methanolacinia petrolearia (strain DSM 11571 / OCM 486 / SEBR 4847) TaxID=679926 RepID=E1RF40_METP4|nr:radical SAM protein [Methanolacinia petrolearia]ADN37284.1 Radical SAM domain protein [Methanolacinia petrolearia DSM 11571]